MPTEPPQIRPAVVADIPEIAGIVEQAYQIYEPRIGRRPAPMDDDYERRVRDGQVFVAEADAVIGLIVLIAAGDRLLIENVAVDPDHQHRGAGRALLLHAEGHARALGISELRLYTNAAMTENLHLYPRLGYVETGRRAENGFQRVYFAKPITPTLAD
jgi:ribosomal protein S18 acetylase RimI-like enzyme